MQEDTYEMGQIILELLHDWSLAGLWVSQKTFECACILLAK